MTTAPRRYRLTLRVDPLPDPAADPRASRWSPDVWARLDDERREWRRALYARFGLKLFSNAWTELDLDHPRLFELSTELERLHAAGAAIPGKGTLFEEPTADETAHAPWFCVRTVAQHGDVSTFLSPYPTVKACQVPGTLHVMNRGIAVSEAVRHAVEEEGLTGIEFVWLRDTGKYQARQWYATIAQVPMGPGVDHEWYGRPHDKWKGFKDIVLAGVCSFHAAEMVAGWSVGDAAADRVLALIPPQELDVQTLRRYQRDSLPATDFAYGWNEGDASGDEGRRFRELFVSRRARDVLLRRGLLAPLDVEPVVVVEPGHGRGPYHDPMPTILPPLATPEELARLRVRERALRAKFDATERPVRAPDLKRALALLRTAKRQRPGDFRPAAKPRVLERVSAALPAVLPASWLQLLRITDGGALGAGGLTCDLVPVAELPAFHAECQARATAEDDTFPIHYVHVGSNEHGDRYALDRADLSLSADCPVVLLSHETGAEERRWGSVAEFLEDVLTA